MSYSFPQYNNFTPSDNYETPYPNIPNHSTGSLDMMSPGPPESSGHETMGANGLMSAYMRLDEQTAASLSTLAPQTLPVMLKAKEICVPSYNRSDFPTEFIWTKEDWKKHLEKPSTQLEKSHPLRFVVDKNNRPVPMELISAIRTTSRRVFVDIWNIKEAPKSWGAASGSASKLYYREMITFFPELGYCDGNWKCDSIATASYTSWRRNHISRLIREGTYKPTVDDMIDFDNLETLDADDINNATDDMKIRKRTRDSQADPLLCTVSTSTKKWKPSEISVVAIKQDSPSLPEDVEQKVLESDENAPPAESQPHTDDVSQMTTVSTLEPTSPLAKTRPSKPARFRARPLQFANPLTTQATNGPPLIEVPPHKEPEPAAPTIVLQAPPEDQRPTAPTSTITLTSPSEDLQPTTPTIRTEPDTPSASDVSTAANSAPMKKSRKMQIGKAQNGRNLCAQEWLARTKNGSAAEFKLYYDGLLAAERMSYNDLAAKKIFSQLLHQVAAGEWPR
ncbi:hypothetical protein EDB19DRAFT_1920085 [Suillus lakei]|nr:hypothetical protein EDB19DRAFT_1920085 [Suillus lakei]